METFDASSAIITAAILTLIAVIWLLFMRPMSYWLCFFKFLRRLGRAAVWSIAGVFLGAWAGWHDREGLEETDEPRLYKADFQIGDMPEGDFVQPIFRRTKRND